MKGEGGTETETEAIPEAGVEVVTGQLFIGHYDGHKHIIICFHRFGRHSSRRSEREKERERERREEEAERRKKEEEERRLDEDKQRRKYVIFYINRLHPSFCTCTHVLIITCTCTCNY